MVGLGTYKAQGTDVKQSVLDAIDIGYRHIDTADYYQVCLHSLLFAFVYCLSTFLELGPNWRGYSRIDRRR